MVIPRRHRPRVLGFESCNRKSALYRRASRCPQWRCCGFSGLHIAGSRNGYREPNARPDNIEDGADT